MGRKAKTRPIAGPRRIEERAMITVATCRHTPYEGYCESCIRKAIRTSIRSAIRWKKTRNKGNDSDG